MLGVHVTVGAGTLQVLNLELLIAYDMERAMVRARQLSFHLEAVAEAVAVAVAVVAVVVVAMVVCVVQLRSRHAGAGPCPGTRA